MEPGSANIILFVCVENTFRSIMSEALFNAHAPNGWHAESAGVKPARAINPMAIELLNEIGIQIESRTPQLVTSVMIERARRVVTFGCLDRCPIGAKEKSEDWPIPGSTDKTWNELRTIRDELLRRSLLLTDRLTEGPGH
jgi:protein-tyrosine-phosphatase